MNREDLYYAIEEEASYQKLIDVLRAVVELHKPVKVPHSDYQSGFGCSALGCQDKYLEPSSYPCPTIQAIEKELQ